MSQSWCSGQQSYIGMSGELLGPFSVAYVKGWRRSVTCLIVADAIRVLGINFDSLSSEYKDGFPGIQKRPTS